MKEKRNHWRPPFQREGSLTRQLAFKFILSFEIELGTPLSVFVTSNTIYMVDRRIASQMVAQDTRNETQSFRQVRALGRR